MRIGAIFVTVLLTQLSISALNDWADRERDAMAQRRRPIAMGRIPPNLALTLAIVFGLGSLPGALLFGPGSALIVLLGLAAGWSYDLVLKPTVLSFLPFAVAFPLLPTWVGLVAGRHVGSFGLLIVGGAFLAVAIHLSDSLPDIATDAAAGLRTLAVNLGPERSLGAIVACLMIGLVFVLASLRFHPVWGLAIGAAALITTVAVFVIGSRHPEQTRWIVSAFAIVAALTMITHLPYG